jgi:alkaline phosphatase
VTFVLYEKDFWQHLAVGRAIWSLHAVPHTQIWTWPTYGAPDMTPSWGFRILLWPIWQAAGVWGMFAWRWATTLAVFGLAFWTSRRMGARGMTPLLVIAIAALTYRQRSRVRPETLASVWLAATLAVLEWRRQHLGGTRGPAPPPWRDPALALVPIVWAWINTHLSYALGLAVLGAYLLDSLLARRPGRAGLVFAGVASMVVAFLNPYGWHAVIQPLEFFTGQRNEPIFRIITELKPLDLMLNLRNLLPLVWFGWPALALWRSWKRRVDWAELVLLLGFVALSFSAQRFLGFTMVVAAPFLSRDLDAWVSSRAWPRWTGPAWSRAAACAGACLLAGAAEWPRPDLPLGVGLKPREYPVVACDFMAREGVAGRGFNQFFLGGYLLYRFWPDRSRLPFMDIHQTGTRADRDLYAYALADPAAWRELDRRHRFDYVLLRRLAYAGDDLVEHLDGDSSFTLVFIDDAAALWVRREGPLATLAQRFGYHDYPAGVSQLGRLGYLATTDSAARVPSPCSSSARRPPLLPLAGARATRQSRARHRRTLRRRASPARRPGGRFEGAAGARASGLGGARERPAARRARRVCGRAPGEPRLPARGAGPGSCVAGARRSGAGAQPLPARARSRPRRRGSPRFPRRPRRSLRARTLTAGATSAGIVTLPDRSGENPSMRRFHNWGLLLALVFAPAGAHAATPRPARPTHVVLMIADGCGTASVDLGRMVGGAPLALDEILVGSVATASTSSRITDSAAGATAMASGVKTANRMVGVDPSGRQLPTVLERARERGMATGLVVKSTMTDATPACFAAHVMGRGAQDTIAVQEIDGGVDLLLGGGRDWFLPLSRGGVRKDSVDVIARARRRGYAVVGNRAELNAARATPLLGLFAHDDMSYALDRDMLTQPGLPEMTRKALALLSRRPAGFFLMVEGSRIDHAGHANDPASHARELLEYDAALRAVLDFARRDGHTLVVCTADHETGGLSLGRRIGDQSLYELRIETLRPVTASTERMADSIAAGLVPAAVLTRYLGSPPTPEEKALVDSAVAAKKGVSAAIGEIESRRALVGWSSNAHTAVDVGLYAYGPGSEGFRGHHENTDIAHLLAEAMGLSLAPRPAGADAR